MTTRPPRTSNQIAALAVRNSPALIQLSEAVANSGLTMAELSQLTGVSAAAITGWLTGTTDPSLSKLESVLRSLGYTLLSVPFGDVPTGCRMRDILPPCDRMTHDAQPDDSATALREMIQFTMTRLTQLQRQLYTCQISDAVYNKEYHDLLFDLKSLCDSAAKQQVTEDHVAFGDDINVMYDGDVTVKRADVGKMSGACKEVTGEDKRQLPPAESGPDAKKD